MSVTYPFPLSIARAGWSAQEIAYAAYRPMPDALAAAPASVISELGVRENIDWSDITVGEKLGKGAFGEVSRGRWRCKGKIIDVALKELNIEGAIVKTGLTREQVAQTFELEVVSLQSASHPNIVRCYGVSHRHMVLEYCERGTLWNAIKAEPPSWAQRWRWAQQLLDGLSYLHQQGMVHRDLKTENVLLDKHGIAKLADLGLVQRDVLVQTEETAAVANQTKDNFWASPEEHQRLAATAKSDVFAFGLLLWQLASGSEITWEWKGALLEAIKQNRAVDFLPADWPTAWKQWIVACWALSLEARPDSQALLQRLRAEGAQLDPDAERQIVLQRNRCLLQETISQREQYVENYAVSYEVREDWDVFWRKQEEKAEDEKATAPLAYLSTQLTQFCEQPAQRVLVLLGDGGVGKSTGVQCFAEKTPLLTIFIRPGVRPWSQQGLNNAIEKTLRGFYGLNTEAIARLRTQRVLFVVDGYDELITDSSAQNLPTQIGLAQWPQAKLLVTCRRNVVNLTDEFARWGFPQITRLILVPFNLTQLLTMLSEQLRFSAEQEARYREQLQQTASLRSILRNPFVLNLFIHAWTRLSALPLSALSRYRIYQESVITSFINTQHCLSLTVQQQLCQTHPDLITSYDSFAAQMALALFKDSAATLNDDPWAHLSELVQEDARATFTRNRQQTSHRSLFTESDYVRVQTDKLEALLGQLALMQREGHWSFRHKTWSDYFIARRILQGLQSPEPTQSLLQILATEPLERDTLRFAGEVFQALTQEELANPLQPGAAASITPLIEGIHAYRHLNAIVLVSRVASIHAKAASNAASLLNAANVSLSALDWHGVRLPQADLSGAVLDSTNLEGADLTGANLQSAWLRQASFKRANLSRLRLGQWPALKMKEAVQCCSYSPDGARLAVTEGNDIVVFEAATSKVLIRLRGHTDWVSSVAWDAQGRLASGSSDNTVRVWDAQQGTELRCLTGHTSFVNSVIWDAQGRLASGSSDNTVRVWDAQQSTELRCLTGHTRPVNSVAWDAQGRLASGSEDSTVRVWDAQQGTELRCLTGHTKEVRSVAWDLQGRLASGSEDNTVRVWDALQGSELRCLTGHTGFVNSVIWDAQGRLASGSSDNTVRVWDAQQGTELRCLTGHTKGVISVAWGAQGRLASGSGDKIVRVWDAQQGTELRCLTRHTDRVTSVAWDAQGRLASGSWDNTVRVWDAQQGTELRCLTGHTDAVKSVAWDAQGRLASGSSDMTMRVWEVASGTELRCLQGQTGPVRSVAWDASGQRLASGSGDRSVRVWEVASGTELRCLQGHTDAVMSVAWDAQGRLASGSWDATVRVWDAQQGTELRCLTRHTDRVTSVAWDAQGRLASGSSDNTVRVWDAASGKELRCLQGHTNGVSSVAWEASGQRLASGTWDNSVRVWDVATGQECWRLDLPQSVASCAFTPSAQGQLLLAVAFAKWVVAFELTPWQNTYHARLCLLAGPAALHAEQLDLTDSLGLSPDNAEVLRQHAASEQAAPAAIPPGLAAAIEQHGFLAQAAASATRPVVVQAPTADDEKQNRRLTSREGEPPKQDAVAIVPPSPSRSPTFFSPAPPPQAPVAAAPVRTPPSAANPPASCCAIL